ncbi:MAG: GyrI-like domain-containing protein [Chitinophagaceae bacterium]
MKLHQEKCTLMGLAVRTTNQGGQSQKDISALYTNFFSNQIPDKIPGKISQDLICAYTEYESDMNGPYTVLLGYKVSDTDIIPDNLYAIKVPPMDYQVFISADARPETVVQTWMKIWQSEIPRAYQTDFDIYLQDGHVETYVSVK